MSALEEQGAEQHHGPDGRMTTSARTPSSRGTSRPSLNQTRSALAAVRGLVDLPDMLSWYEGAMVELEAVISASLTFRSGKLCDNLPVWKESRRV